MLEGRLKFGKGWDFLGESEVERSVDVGSEADVGGKGNGRGGGEGEGRENFPYHGNNVNMNKN